MVANNRGEGDGLTLLLRDDDVNHKMLLGLEDPSSHVQCLPRSSVVSGGDVGGERSSSR